MSVPAAPSIKPMKQLQASAPAEHETVAKTKALPVLPWMRVPISIENGTGIPLIKVRGLHPLALFALQECKAFSTDGFPAAAV